MKTLFEDYAQFCYVGKAVEKTAEKKDRVDGERAELVSEVVQIAFSDDELGIREVVLANVSTRQERMYRVSVYDDYSDSLSGSMGFHQRANSYAELRKCIDNLVGNSGVRNMSELPGVIKIVKTETEGRDSYLISVDSRYKTDREYGIGVVYGTGSEETNREPELEELAVGAC